MDGFPTETYHNGNELTEKRRKICLGENRFSDGIMYRDYTTDSIKLSPNAFISVVYFAGTFNMPTSYQ